METFADFITNNKIEIIGCLIIVILAAIKGFMFFTASKEKQVKQIEGWLLTAVTQAEKLYGGGTGRIKLSYVYDKFVERFPWLAKLLSFDDFSKYVDNALIEMRRLLESNKAVAAIVSGK